MKTPKRHFRINDALWTRFKEIAENKNVTASDLLRELIANCVEKNINDQQLTPFKRAEPHKYILNFNSTVEWEVTDTKESRSKSGLKQTTFYIDSCYSKQELLRRGYSC